MSLLLSTDHARLYFYPEQQLFELCFVGFVSGDEFRAPYEQALNLAYRHGATRWLTDYAQMHAVRQADQDWLVEDFAPRVINRLRYRLTRTAIVLSSDPMNQLYTNAVVERTSDLRPWTTRFFDNRAEALVWLTAPTDLELSLGR